MRFRKAVAETPGLSGAWKPGLKALKRADRGRIRCTRPRTLTGSVDVDAGLRADRPNEPRWDYAIGLARAGRGEQVLWIEVHPASTANVPEVLAKLQWLKTRLRGEGKRLEKLDRKYLWIASGAVAIGRHTRQARLLAQHGLAFPRERHEISG